MGKVQIKICGITRKEEIDWLLEEKVDYIGMVLFFPKSKRNLEVKQATELLRYLKKKEGHNRTLSVAVTVSPTGKQVMKLKQAGFDLLQVHGELLREVAENSPLPIIRAQNVSGAIVQAEDEFYAGLYDAAQPGSGQNFDWDSLVQIRTQIKTKLFLAGGLTVDNVAEAIRKIRPDAVDVSSAVEVVSPDGVFRGKDREKIRAFVQAVRKNSVEEGKEEKKNEKDLLW